MLQGYVAREELEKQVQDMLQHSSGASVKSKQREKLIELQGADGMVAGSSRVWRRCRLPATGI